MEINAAVLIQDIREFRYLVWRYILKGIVEHSTPEDRLPPDFGETVLLWLIRDRIERIHGLTDPSHTPKDLRLYRMVDVVEQALQVEERFSDYISVPPVYGDNNHIEVRLDGFDLFIYYRKEVYTSEIMEFKGYDANHDFRHPWPRR